ncbi:hypothetical protein ACP4OV_018373 [Aristida adscensionis]
MHRSRRRPRLPAATAAREPRLGDLVLAKVRGYPALACQGRPEDSGQTPAPSKCFVNFYGTKESGFVALVDLWEFNEEAKNELLDQAPNVKLPKIHTQHFSEAVEQICKDFDELPKPTETSRGALMSRATGGPGSHSLAISYSPRSSATHPRPPRVRRPEDSGLTPVSHKYSACFYGTTDISGFVALADLSEFSVEAKNEVLNRAPCIKLPKIYSQYFSETVEQICKEFDEVPKSFETLICALHEQSEKPTDNHVKLRDDGDTPGSRQMEGDSSVSSSNMLALGPGTEGDMKDAGHETRDSYLVVLQKEIPPRNDHDHPRTGNSVASISALGMHHDHEHSPITMLQKGRSVAPGSTSWIGVLIHIWQRGQDLWTGPVKQLRQRQRERRGIML